MILLMDKTVALAVGAVTLLEQDLLGVLEQLVRAIMVELLQLRNRLTSLALVVVQVRLVQVQILQIMVELV
jgi:hypothetical protein